jgi:hypothetical protein
LVAFSIFGSRNAYRQQQIALHGENLQREEAAAADKARQGAMIFQHTQGYAQEIANGVPPAIALSHYPLVGTAAASMLQRQAAAERERDYGDIQTIDLPNGAKGVYRKGSPGMHVINEPRGSDFNSAIQKAAFASEMHQLDRDAREKDANNNFKMSRADVDVARQALVDKYSQMNQPKPIQPASQDAGSSLGSPSAPVVGNWNIPDPNQNLGGSGDLPQETGGFLDRALGGGFSSPDQPKTSSPVSNNLYQVGKKYRNLIYLGGDPNSQESWQDADKSGVPTGSTQGPDQGSGE